MEKYRSAVRAVLERPVCFVKTAADPEKEVERLFKVFLPGTEWANKLHAVGGE